MWYPEYACGILSCPVQVGRARFRAPELLFHPHLVGEEGEGIHEVLAFAIRKSDMDLRKIFYSNIVLSGGSTLFRGQRLSPRCLLFLLVWFFLLIVSSLLNVYFKCLLFVNCCFLFVVVCLLFVTLLFVVQGLVTGY